MGSCACRYENGLWSNPWLKTLWEAAQKGVQETELRPLGKHLRVPNCCKRLPVGSRDRSPESQAILISVKQFRVVLKQWNASQGVGLEIWWYHMPILQLWAYFAWLCFCHLEPPLNYGHSLQLDIFFRDHHEISASAVKFLGVPCSTTQLKHAY